MNKENLSKRNFSRRKFIKGITFGTTGALFMINNPTELFGEEISKKELVFNNVFEKKIGVKLYYSILPVLHKADVIVVGGSLAGISAALDFAKNGSKVVLIEFRNYLGYNISASLRPWINLGRLANQPPEPFATCLEKMQAVGQIDSKINKEEIPLWIDAFKVSSEDVLLNAGVKIIYSSQPIDTITDKGKIGGVVIGNKSGRQVIISPLVIDASSTAIVARLVGGEFEPESDKMFQFTRTIEMTGVENFNNSKVRVPVEMGVTKNELIVHQGYLGKDHILIECPMELKLGKMDMEGMMLREIEARHRSMKIASYLIKNIPSFKNAKLGFCSNELNGPQTTRLTNFFSEWAEEFNSYTLKFNDKKNKQINLNLKNFAGPINGLWCLNNAARFDDKFDELILDPINATLLGAFFAKAVLTGTQNQKNQDSFLNQYNPNNICNIFEAFSYDIKSQVSPQKGRYYEEIAVPEKEVPIKYNVDFVVVGGGTSGATCANSAGREGLKTVMLELGPGLGGTGTIGGVSAYWYGRYWDAFCYRNAKMVDEVHESINWPSNHAYRRNGSWNKECKMYALLKDALDSEVKVLFNTISFATIMQDNKVCGVITSTPYGPMAVLGKITADTTGDGDIAAFAGAKYTFGIARDYYPMLYNLANYPKPTTSQWHFMHTVDVTNVEDLTRGILVGRRRGPQAHDHGIYIATRESRHIVGDITVSLTDMLRHRPYHDVINLGAGQMDCHRRIASDWIRMGLLIPILPTEMPLRAITPRGLENILVGGKAYSGKHDTLFNMRNMPDLENLGGAMGVVAAHAIREGVSPRRVNLTNVQKRLLEVGTLLPDMLSRETKEVPYNEKEIRDFIRQLDGTPLYDWYDIEMAKENEPNFRKKIPIVEVCTSDPKLTIPILEEELVKSEGARKIQLAQALSMFGVNTGVPVLIEEIERQISEGKVPPDHTSLPKLRGGDGNRRIPPADLLYSLAMTRDSRSLVVWDKIADLIKPEPKDFESEVTSAEQQNTWVYQYVDAICYGAELLSDPKAISTLKKIHKLPLLNNLSEKDGIQIHFSFERRALIELLLGRAMAHLGDIEGYQILISYLDDNRATLAGFAHMALVEKTGIDLNKNPKLWEQLLSSSKYIIKPLPPLIREEG